MLSGVRLSCYQEYETAGEPVTARVYTPLNFTNLNTLTFNKETGLRWATAERRKAPPSRRQKQPQNQPRSAGQKPTGFPDRRAAP
ncbi:hypothetical protein IPC1387_35065 [Pseudomonas aeruginosa]|nr:hypothetical protein IPC1387_35065 [Pseudomonas aeruginosa]